MGELIFHTNICECLFISSGEPVSYFCGTFSLKIFCYLISWGVNIFGDYLFSYFPLILWHIPYFGDDHFHKPTMLLSKSFPNCALQYTSNALCDIQYSITGCLVSLLLFIDHGSSYVSLDLMDISPSRCGAFFDIISWVWCSCCCISSFLVCLIEILPVSCGLKTSFY